MKVIVYESMFDSRKMDKNRIKFGSRITSKQILSGISASILESKQKHKDLIVSDHCQLSVKTIY